MPRDNGQPQNQWWMNHAWIGSAFESVGNVSCDWNISFKKVKIGVKKAKKLIVLESRRVVNLHVGSSRWATIKTLIRQFLCSLVICKALVNKLSEGVCLFAVNRLLLVFMVAKQFHSSLRNKTKRRLRGAKSHNLRFHRNNVLTKKSVHDVGVIFGHG